MGRSNIRIDGIIEALSFDNLNAQVQAAEELGKLGPAAKSALPAIQAALNKISSQRFQTAAQVAIEKIGK